MSVNKSICGACFDGDSLVNRLLIEVKRINKPYGNVLCPADIRPYKKKKKMAKMVREKKADLTNMIDFNFNSWEETSKSFSKKIFIITFHTLCFIYFC